MLVTKLQTVSESRVTTSTLRISETIAAKFCMCSWLPWSIQGNPTVDGKTFSRHEAGGVGCQINHRSYHFIGVGQAS